MDAGRVLRDTVTGQGAGLPQQPIQEVVAVPVPQIQESAELHSPERIDDQIDGDVPPITLNSSLLRFMEETVGKIIPRGCKESRTVEQLCGRFQPIGFRSTPSKRTGVGSANAEASDESVDMAHLARGAPFSFQLHWAFSTHTESGIIPVFHVAQSCFAM